MYPCLIQLRLNVQCSTILKMNNINQMKASCYSSCTCIVAWFLRIMRVSTEHWAGIPFVWSIFSGKDRINQETHTQIMRSNDHIQDVTRISGLFSNFYCSTSNRKWHFFVKYFPLSARRKSIPKVGLTNNIHFIAWQMSTHSMITINYLWMNRLKLRGSNCYRNHITLCSLIFL